jgi:aminotransferase in exopolysaccharide biosynthesis
MDKNKFIPLSVPNLKGNELEYLTIAVQSEWVSSAGKYVNQFESMISSYLGIENAISCQNGTSGLHLALLALNINNSHEVLVPTLTFIAAVNPVKYVGAEPIFMDCDDSLCIDPIKLEKFLNNECSYKNDKVYNNLTGKHIVAIIIVHVFGNIADMEKIVYLAKKFKLYIIEDATEALGTKYIKGEFFNKYAGTIGDIGVFSFNGNKIITTGGGGMVVTKNTSISMKIRHLSTQAKSDELYFYHDEIGYNYRMTNLQAALGIAQLEQLESFISIKERNYISYKTKFNSISNYDLLPFRKDTRPNYWFYSLVNNNKRIVIDNFITCMQNMHTQVRPIWGLIHQQKPYLNCQIFEIENAYNYVQKVINIPCSSNLSPDDVELVTERILSL